MTSFKLIAGSAGVMEYICSNLQLKQLSALEPICTGVVITQNAWALAASHRLTRYAFAPGAAEGIQMMTKTKEDIKSMLKSLKAVWVAKTIPDMFDFPGRKKTISPRVLVPTSQSSRKLVKAVFQAERKAAKHLANGGKVAKVFLARFLFEKEVLKQMEEMLIAHKTTNPDQPLKDIPWCTRSHTATFPMARIPDAKQRRRYPPQAPAWQVPTVNLAMSCCDEQMWLKRVDPPAGEFRGSEVTTRLAADLVGISEYLTLHMAGTDLQKEPDLTMGTCLCAASNRKALYDEISTEGLTCVLFIRDYDVESMEEKAISRTVQALQISHSEAYNNGALSHFREV